MFFFLYTTAKKTVFSTINQWILKVTFYQVCIECLSSIKQSLQHFVKVVIYLRPISPQVFFFFKICHVTRVETFTVFVTGKLFELVKFQAQDSSTTTTTTSDDACFYDADGRWLWMCVVMSHDMSWTKSVEKSCPLFWISKSLFGFTFICSLTKTWRDWSKNKKNRTLYFGTRYYSPCKETPCILICIINMWSSVASRGYFITNVWADVLVKAFNLQL